jgi:hypothetical protein
VERGGPAVIAPALFVVVYLVTVLASISLFDAATPLASASFLRCTRHSFPRLSVALRCGGGRDRRTIRHCAS